MRYPQHLRTKILMCLIIHLSFINLFDIRLPEDDLKRSKHVAMSVDFKCKCKCKLILVHLSLLFIKLSINPLNPELNPICYLLALLGAHHFLHVSRIRVKLLTLRLLMSYIQGVTGGRDKTSGECSLC